MNDLILFVVLDQYADWEAAYLAPLINGLAPEKYLVKTVSLGSRPIRSMGGFTLLPDYDLRSVPADFSALILVGGLSWRKDEARGVEALVRKALAGNRVVGGICDATVFLGKMGALNDARHTSNLLSDLQQWAGPNYTGAAVYQNQPVVRDGRLITANGTAALEFAREVLLALEAAPEKKIEQWYNFHKLGACRAPMPDL